MGANQMLLAMYALVDCNNFYVSCERVFRPDWTARPVVVLSNNDGCVISRSQEAKDLGIPMGAPAFQYQSLFRQQGVVVLSANFALYADMSHRVMTTLADFAPDLEVYSIDEAFLSWHGLAHTARGWRRRAQRLRRCIRQHTGIPISVGVAPTKALTKVANRIAKKFPAQTRGVVVLDTARKQEKALRWLPIEDVWGIGRQRAARLGAMGVRTAWDFAQLPEAWVRQHLSVVGWRLQRDLRGVPTLRLERVRRKKRIATTRSFATDYTEWAQVHERVSTFATCCAEKLRRQQSQATGLTVFVMTNRHRDQPQYARSAYRQLPFPTASAVELSRFATGLLRAIFQEGYAYKKAGVIVTDLQTASRPSPDLFGQGSDPRHVALMAAMDQLNQRFGQQKVRLASQDPRQIWKMKQEQRTPRYTTRLAEVIRVRA